MLVERGLQVMNVEVVGDAYAIASNYLRKTGAIADSFATNERLLEIIVEMFQRGEFNKIRLANKAIASSKPRTGLTASNPSTAEDPMEAAIDRIMHDLRSAGEPHRRRQRRGARQGDGISSPRCSRPARRTPHRLTVCGLTYLRELDGSSDPVKAGFTGL